MLCVQRSVLSKILNYFSNPRSIVSSAHMMEATLNKSQEEQLNKLYPDPKAIKLKVDLHFPNCTLHLLRIPKSIDPELLLDKKIKLQKSECKVKIDGEKYVVEKTTKNPDPVLVLGKTAKVLTLQSNFIMKKFIKPNPEPELEASEKASVAVLDNLKTRHPLFGSAFTDKVIVEEEIQTKLDNAILKLQKSKEKTPTKKSSKHKKEDQEVIFSLLADKNQSKADVSDDSAFSSCGSLSKVDKRRRKDTNDFLQSMVRNVKQEVLTAYETEGEVESSPREKKKKRKSADHVMRRTSGTTDNGVANHKHKSGHGEPLKQEAMTTYYETESEDQLDIRNKNSDDYVINPKREVLTSYETEGETELGTKKKKKKKKKGISEREEDREHDSSIRENEVLFNISRSLKEEMVSTYETEGEGDPNTKQRKKKRSSGSMKQGVLASYESGDEMETSPNKKKKRNSSAVKSEELASYETDVAEEGSSKKKKKRRSSQHNQTADLSLVKNEMDTEASLEDTSFMFNVESFSTLGSEFESPKKKRKSDGR